MLLAQYLERLSLADIERIARNGIGVFDSGRLSVAMKGERAEAIEAACRRITRAAEREKDRLLSVDILPRIASKEERGAAAG